MDNIQKMILGVLGFAGVLVMLVPSQVDIPPQQPPVVASNAVPAAPPAAPEGDAMADEGQAETVEESEFSDEDIFATGEPVIDGNPAQSPSNSDPQQTEQYVAPTYDYSQPITVPGIATPQPVASPDQQQMPAI